MHYILANILLLLVLPFRKVRSDALIVVCVFMSIFTICYMDGSADYKGYLAYFLCSQNEHCLRSGELNFERSYVLISNSFYSLFSRDGGDWVIAFYSTIALCIKLIVMKGHARHFGIALMCYASYAWYVHEMTQIRIGLAIAFYWLAVVHHSENRHGRSLIYMLFAIFFHLSTLVGLIVYALRFVKVSSRTFFIVCASGSAVGLAVSGSPAFLSTILSLGFVDPRIATYSDAIGNIVSSTNFLTVYFVASVVLLLSYALTVSDEQSTEFERYGFRLGCIGMLYYAFLYWIPTVGLRGLEFLLCFTPFMAAAIFKTRNSLLLKAVVVTTFVLIFYNLVVRNGTRTDFVLPGQAQEAWME